MLGGSATADFLRRFQVPAVAEPYISRIVTDDEVRLVLAAEGPLTVEAAAAALGADREAAAASLHAAFRRGVLDRREEDGRALYEHSNFYGRLDTFATFDDAWYDLPVEARRALDEWMLDEHLESVRPAVTRLLAGQTVESSPGNDSILLLHELDTIVDSARAIVVVPCNCRRLGHRCERPLETCVQFDAAAEKKLARGLGRRLTNAEAKALLRWADKKGLMHTTDLSPGEDGPAAICNCCADDCYVFRGAARLGSNGTWPRSRYLAVFDAALCNRCGLCVKRCHFGAFAAPGPVIRGKPLPEIAFSPTLCWGCGLCANTCPTGAIAMAPID